MPTDNIIKKCRMDYIDIYRAFGIILMVMGHIGFGGKFDKFIHAFHMPMFFFISGFFYKEKVVDMRKYVINKAKKLLIPYFVFGGGCCFLWCLNSGISAEPWIHLFLTNTTGIPIVGAIWFLTALFFTDVIYMFLVKHGVKWIVLVFVVIGSCADQMLPYPLPWALSAAFVGLGLYWIGNETARNQDKLKNALNIPGPLCIILGLLEVKLILSNGYINMREGTYAFVPLFWLNVLLSIFIGISLSKKVESIIRGTHVANWLTSIGRDSIVYLCCNQLVIKVVTVVFEHFAAPSVVENILVLMASMMFLYILSVLFTKTRLKILVGK